MHVSDAKQIQGVFDLTYSKILFAWLVMNKLPSVSNQSY